MPFISKGNFDKLYITEKEKVQYLRLINISELIDKLRVPKSNEPILNANGTQIEPNFCLGSFVSVADGIFSVLLGRQSNPYIYRGQNFDYPEFVPTALRQGKNTEENLMNNCVNWIKKADFLEFFKTTPYYKRCKTFQVFDCMYDFDLEAIAQHYGFISNYIDITKELYIAMFFAYTYYDQNQRKYLPISDFKTYQPTLYISNLVDIYKELDSSFKFVGFQSLLRPRLQHAMALDASNLKLKARFQKVELPQNEIIAREIYEQFREGTTLVPDDYISQVAYNIQDDKTINESLFERYCEEKNADKNMIKNLLVTNGYELDNTKYIYTEYDEYMMNRELDDKIIPFLKEFIAVSPQISNLRFTI